MNEQLLASANGIKDASLKANALSLLEIMGSEIEGVGDRPIKWYPPQVRVIQSMTDTGSMPDGAKAGKVIIGGEDLLEKETDIIPLLVWDSRIMWDPDPQNKMKVCESPDSKTGWKYGTCRECAHGKWVDDVPAPCRKQKNVLAILGDLSNVVMVSFSKSQYAQGKEWEGLIRKARVATYRKTYSLSAGKNPKNPKVYTMLVEGIPEKAIPDDVLDFLRTLFEQVKGDREDHKEAFAASIAKRLESNSPRLENNGADVDIVLEADEGTSDSADTATDYKL